MSNALNWKNKIVSQKRFKIGDTVKLFYQTKKHIGKNAIVIGTLKSYIGIYNLRFINSNHIEYFSFLEFCNCRMLLIEKINES